MKQEYKSLYEKFGLNIVYYRKKTVLHNCNWQSW